MGMSCLPVGRALLASRCWKLRALHACPAACSLNLAPHFPRCAVPHMCLRRTARLSTPTPTCSSWAPTGRATWCGPLTWPAACRCWPAACWC